jgi:hypothetical protein
MLGYVLLLVGAVVGILYLTDVGSVSFSTKLDQEFNYESSISMYILTFLDIAPTQSGSTGNAVIGRIHFSKGKNKISLELMCEPE